MSSPSPHPIRSPRDLIVWQKAMDLVEAVYKATASFPKAETYALTSQIRRAVVSIPANIAEGQGRRLTKEYLYFLANARLTYLTGEHYSQLRDQLNEVPKILNGLTRAVEQSSNI